MGYKKVSGGQRSDGELFSFTQPGDSFEGTLVQVRNVHTKNGNSQVADFQDLNGKAWAIFITAGMKDLLDPEMIGERIQLVYTGTQHNENTNRDFKAFEIGVWSEDDEPLGAV